MTFKSRVESNPFISLIVTGTAVGAVVAAVISFFCSQRLEEARTQIADRESKLASINRNLAGGDFMKVEKFLARRGDRSHVPAQSKFYPDDSFYAPEIKGWIYTKVTDRVFFTSIFGKEAEKQMSEITGIAPMHVWTRGPLKPVGNNDVIENFAPSIYVQRLPLDELTVQLNLEAAKNSQPTTLFEGDVIGSMLAQTFSNIFKKLTITSDTQASLLSITKVSNVLYCQFLVTIHDVTIDGRALPSYFINLEMIVISTPKSVYTICDLVPSEEPVLRGSVPAEVTEWLSGFAVFAD
jgi:hypothetical protein